MTEVLTQYYCADVHTSPQEIKFYGCITHSIPADHSTYIQITNNILSINFWCINHESSGGVSSTTITKPWGIQPSACSYIGTAQALRVTKMPILEN